MAFLIAGSISLLNGSVSPILRIRSRLGSPIGGRLFLKSRRAFWAIQSYWFLSDFSDLVANFDTVTHWSIYFPKLEKIEFFLAGVSVEPTWLTAKRGWLLAHCFGLIFRYLFVLIFILNLCMFVCYLPLIRDLFVRTRSSVSGAKYWPLVSSR